MVALLIVAVFFSMSGRVVFSPLMPYLQQELSISLSTVGTLFLLVNLGFSVVMMFSGFLAARIGHGNTIVFALASIAVGLFISGTAGSTLVLAAGMICIGSGAGTYAPSGIAMINTKISVEKRSIAFSFHEIGPNMAMLVAPLIVLLGVPLAGWRGVVTTAAGIGYVPCVIMDKGFKWRGAASEILQPDDPCNSPFEGVDEFDGSVAREACRIVEISGAYGHYQA